MATDWTVRVHVYTCKACGFDFDHLTSGRSKRTMCDDCRREQRARVQRETNKTRHEHGRAPVRTLGSYEMGAELTRLRIAIELIGPLLRMNRPRAALAVADWAAAPDRTHL